MALLALRGVRSPKVDLALEAAVRFLGECRSADALDWLRLGLMAHERLPRTWSPPRELALRTPAETSLHLLAARAEKGNHSLWC